MQMQGSGGTRDAGRIIGWWRTVENLQEEGKEEAVVVHNNCLGTRSKKQKVRVE